MKNICLLQIVLSFLFLQANATDYFVAKTGNNTNNGTTLTQPFLTIQKATDVAATGDVVYIRTGVYREMVDIKSGGVTFQPYNNEIVTINGTDLLTNWTLESGSTYKATMGWDVDLKWGANQLFSDGKMIELARWPDQTSADIVMPTNAIADNVTAVGQVITITDADFNEPDGRWLGAKIWINLSRNGYDGQGYTATVTATSQAAHTITLTYVTPYNGNPVIGNAPWGMGAGTEYFLFDPTPTGVNATGGADALLSNGEWWKNGTTVYVKTPNGGIPNATGTGTNVIEAKRRHFAFWASTPRAGYSIKNFNLFACAITTDNNPFINRSVILEPAHDIVIDGLNIKYVSHQTDMTQNFQDQHYYGAGLVLRGRNNIIRNCTIQYSATAALHISGFGNKALNNVIAHTNYMCSNAGALTTGFICLDAEIANNEIYNTTVMAINFRYAKNSNINVPDVFRIHHNTIYNFLRRSGDSGAIDNFGSDLQWARIDHNVIYNTTPVTGTMIHGIYLDFAGVDDLSHCTVDHNIIYNVPQPVMASSTRFVNIYNNVLFTNTDQPCISNSNGNTKGADMKIYNNIMNKAPNIIGQYGYDVSLSDIQNNIFDAFGVMLDNLFVNAAAHDYHLKPTATMAIDQGRSVGRYDVNVIGLPDLGVFENGSIVDNTAPSTPTGLIYHTLTNNSFKLKWTAATDNTGGTVNYDVYLNDVVYKTTYKTEMDVVNLLGNTEFVVSIKAKDNAGNLSGFSNSVVVKTLPASTIHIEAEHYSSKSGGYKELFGTVGAAIAGFNTGNYLRFDNVTLSGQNIFSANLARPNATNEHLEIRLNSTTGSLLGTLKVPSTTSWSDYRLQTTTLTNTPTGVYSVFIIPINANSGACNLDWIEFSDTQAPTDPANLSSTGITPTSFNLQWGASSDNTGVTSYDVYVNGVFNSSSPTASVSINNLNAATSYSITVRAKDAGNNISAVSAVLNVTTLADVPVVSGVIATWNLTGANNPNGAVSASVTTKDANLTVSALTRNAGMGNSNSSFQNSIQGTGVSATSLAEAITNNEYIEFTISPASGKSLTITSMDVSAMSQGQPATCTLLSSVGGEWVAGSTVSSIALGTGNETGISNQTLTVSGHTNLTIPVTFRFYFHAATNQNYKAFGIGERHTGTTTADLIVKGSVATAITTSLTNNTQRYLLLSPNPATDKLSLNFGEVIDNVTIYLLDLQGRSLISKEAANTSVETINIHSLDTGVYVVKVVSNGKLTNAKFVKK